MSNLLNAVIPALGWSLLHFLWQGLLIGCVAALLLHALRNARPQARYLVACSALLLCAALPLANFAWRLADAADTGYVLPAPLETAAIAAIPGAADGQGAETALVDVDAMASWEYLLRRQMPWLVLLWAAGAALMTLRLSLGLQWVRTRTLPNHYHADAGWQARATALAQRMGIRRPVRLGVSDDALEGPITAGILRPIVLLPASLVSGLPPDLLEALLAHELAHVRRHDYLVNLVQSGIEIFLFYHPSVWMLSQMHPPRTRTDSRRLSSKHARRTAAPGTCTFRAGQIPVHHPSLCCPRGKRRRPHVPNQTPDPSRCTATELEDGDPAVRNFCCLCRAVCPRDAASSVAPGRQRRCRTSGAGRAGPRCRSRSSTRSRTSAGARRGDARDRCRRPARGGARAAGPARTAGSGCATSPASAPGSGGRSGAARTASTDGSSPGSAQATEAAQTAERAARHRKPQLLLHR